MPKFVFSIVKEEILPRGMIVELAKNKKAKKTLKASILPQLEYKPKQ